MKKHSKTSTRTQRLLQCEAEESLAWTKRLSYLQIIAGGESASLTIEDMRPDQFVCGSIEPLNRHDKIDTNKSATPASHERNSTEVWLTSFDEKTNKFVAERLI